MTSLLATVSRGTGGTAIPVPISYEIIRLFSEGLYQSPHKAVEELVSNSFDAGAKVVSVVVPADPGDAATPESLWVIDDGSGMDAEGFKQLWRVADSRKADLDTENGRSQIGQFGIGKLAAFVLAWNLTHVEQIGRWALPLHQHGFPGRHRSPIRSRHPAGTGLPTRDRRRRGQGPPPRSGDSRPGLLGAALWRRRSPHMDGRRT